VLTHIHHVEDLMGEGFPVPMSIGSDLEMTLIDGEAEIPFTLRRRGFTWKRDMWKLRDIMEPTSCGNGGFTMSACSRPEPATSPKRCWMRPSGASRFTRSRDAIGGGGTMRFHHVGYATRNIDLYVEDFFRPVFAPLSISEKVSDPIQRVTVCFARMQGNAMIELVEPFGENSPIDSVLDGDRGGVYHLCYEVDDLTGKSHVAGSGGACRLANPFRLLHSTDVELSSC